MECSFDSSICGFSVKMKGIVWVLRVYGYIKREKVVRYWTGFSITDDGLVITAAHFLNNINIETLEARRLDEDNFPYKANILRLKPTWEIALLRIEGVVHCEFGKVADDGTLFEGQSIFHIGHPFNFVGSFLMGRVAYSCVDDPILPSNHATCKEHRSRSLDITPRYRVMGDIWDEVAFDKSGSNVSCGYAKNLHPLIPVIQCSGFVCGEGCSGGPVLNNKGDIVGMLAMGCGGYEIAVHVSLLKKFLEQNEEYLPSDMENLKRKALADSCSKGDFKKVAGSSRG